MSKLTRFVFFSYISYPQLVSISRPLQFQRKNSVTNDIINNKRKIDIKYLFIIQIYECSSIFFIASISFSSWLLHTNTLTIWRTWHLFFRFCLSLSHSLWHSVLCYCCCCRAYMMLFVVESQPNQQNSLVFCLLILGRLHETWPKLT